MLVQDVYQVKRKCCLIRGNFTLEKYMIFTLSNVMIEFLKQYKHILFSPSYFAMATSLNSKLMIRATKFDKQFYG